MLLSLFAFYNRFFVGVIVFWLHPFLSNRFLCVHDGQNILEGSFLLLQVVLSHQKCKGIIRQDIF